MTQFTDPHLLGGGRAQTPNGATIPQQVAQAGYPSAPVPITANVTVTVPPPIGNVGGAVPPNLSWATIANCSPFALTCGGATGPAFQTPTAVANAGRFIGTIPPFTIAKVALDPSASNNGFSITPQTYANIIQDMPVSGVTGVAFNNQLAGPNVAYVTWYEYEPLGAFPCGIGPGFPLTSQMLIQFTTPALSAGPFTQNVQLEPWMQTIAVRVNQTAGTANGFRVVFTDLMVGQPTAFTVVQDNQWTYLPVNGMSGTITITNLLNGAAGGTLTGQFMVHGLAGPCYTPRNAQIVNPLTGVPITQLGLTTGEVSVANGVTATVIPTNPTGSIIRVRRVLLWFANAPAATVRLVLLGTISGLTYWMDFSGVVAGVTVHSGAIESFLVGQSGLIDPTEGLQFQNNSSQTCRCHIDYDLLPYPMGTEAP